MQVAIDEAAGKAGLVIGHLVIEGIENKKNRNGRMEKLVKALEHDVKSSPKAFLEKGSLKAYDKLIAPSVTLIESKEAAPKILANMILERGYLPNISRVVDCMNTVSVETGLTVSIWNAELVKGSIAYRLSSKGEKYWPFMGEEVELPEGELIASDEEKVLCLVRYRDSKYAPVTVETRSIVVHIQGVYGITAEAVNAALDKLGQLLLENVGGEIKEKLICH